MGRNSKIRAKKTSRRKRDRDSDSSSESDERSEYSSDDGYSTESFDFTDKAFQGLSASYLPDEDHPSYQLLRTLDLREMPEHFFITSFGIRRTGKSWTITSLIEPIADRFDFCYLFSATAGLHEGDGEANFDFIVPDAKFEGYDPNILKRIFERQKAVKEFNNKCDNEKDKKPNETLIIFDDFIHDKRIRYDELFTKLPVLGRHFDISVICLSQTYASCGTSGLNPATRTNNDLVLTFLPRNIVDMERVATTYLTKPKAESMWFIKTCCSEEHQVLGMKLDKPFLTEFEDYCYVYTAPEKLPKYECGKVQWKLLKEEQRRAKKAKLSHHINNDSRLGIRPANMMPVPGEATGIPKHSTNASTLFGAFHSN